MTGSDTFIPIVNKSVCTCATLIAWFMAVTLRATRIHAGGLAFRHTVLKLHVFRTLKCCKRLMRIAKEHTAVNHYGINKSLLCVCGGGGCNSTLKYLCSKHIGETKLIDCFFFKYTGYFLLPKYNRIFK